MTCTEYRRPERTLVFNARLLRCNLDLSAAMLASCNIACEVQNIFTTRHLGQAQRPQTYSASATDVERCSPSIGCTLLRKTQCLKSEKCSSSPSCDQTIPFLQHTISETYPAALFMMVSSGTLSLRPFGAFFREKLIQFRTGVRKEPNRLGEYPPTVKI